MKDKERKRDTKGASSSSPSQRLLNIQIKGERDRVVDGRTRVNTRKWEEEKNDDGEDSYKDKRLENE